MAVPAAPDPVGPGRYRTDVAIVGAGVAGLYAAVRLPDGVDVTIVDKGTPGRSGSSPWAQGGMAVALGPDDSPELHAEDTIRAGDGLCDPRAAAVLAHEAPAHTHHLLELGAEFDRDGDALHLAREGGQRVARSVHRADATGAEMVRVLRDAASPRVSRLPGIAVATAGRPDHRVGGLWVLHPTEGVVLLEAKAVLLATGGCGGLYAATTNQDHATADGVALAHRAGAAVRDAEFVQFHPTGLAIGGSWRFLLTEALRGAGATLHDMDGSRFMTELHPDAELAPRHVVASAILRQPGGVWLDATAIGEAQLEHEFPTVLHGARQHGFDLAAERVPVTPAAHYMVGGVRTDLHGRTSVPGLYAAGEVASTGVHGANRMAGNSLSEALVFGARAAATITHELSDAHAPTGPVVELDGAPLPPDDRTELRQRLREAMWRDAGPARDASGLARVRRRLRELSAELGPPAADAEHVELDLALRSAELIVAAAQLRTESRGGHHRTDHPGHSPAWAGVHTEQVRSPDGSPS